MNIVEIAQDVYKRQELDHAVMKEIRKLGESKADFLVQMEQSRKLYTGSREEGDRSLAMLQAEAGKLQKKMNALVDSLADMGAGTARMQVARRIATLDREQEALRERIREHQAWINQRELTQSEFEGMKPSLAGFATSRDGLGMEQQRSLIHS